MLRRSLALVPILASAAAASQPGELPQDRLQPKLDRGICIDRQFRAIPPEPMMRIAREDIRAIRSMGFEFAKVIVNPEPLLADGRLGEAGRAYLKELVGTVVDGGLPAVVCIHPEWEYKRKVLSRPGEFERFAGFLEDVARILAAGWGPDRIALQLMTEPGGNELSWNELQPRLWRAARRAMPRHALILAGDQTGRIEGLLATEPVDDENVLYSFTFYDPFILTLQGAEWIKPEWWSHLGGVPYPASPEAVRAALPAILARIPASPPEWRPEVERRLVAYGEERWDAGRIAARIGRVAEWNRAHGGRRRLWCAEFGCYQRSIDPAARLRYLEDVRRAFEAHGIGWAYWSYNETFTIMAAGGRPFGPAAQETPDGKLLDALLGAARRR
jgi:endoglucanase